MKKSLLKIAAATIGLFFGINTAKAQLPDGSILSSNMVFTDINGNTHDIFAYLDAGKTVVIDVSATWCGPCWSYHNSKKLDSLQAKHGVATGTTNIAGSISQDFVVLFIEGDASTAQSLLNGPASADTQGDWVTGTKYPIINITASSQIAPLKVGFFPTQYIICPDRMVRHISPSVVGAPTLGQFLRWRNNGCTFQNASGDAGIINTYSNLNQGLFSCDSVIPKFRLANYGTSPLTAATIEVKVNGTTQKTVNWTGSLATYASTVITAPKVGSNTTGSKTITFVVTNSNGVVDTYTLNNSLNASFAVLPSTGGPTISEGYQGGSIPSNQIVSNPDGDITWAVTTTGFNSSASVFMDFWNYGSEGEKDELILPAVSFAGQSTGSINFDVAYTPYGTTAVSKDSLKVYVSTNCGQNWTRIWHKGGAGLKTAPQLNSQSTPFEPTGPSEWRFESVSLATYSNNPNVIVKFQAVNDYGDNLYLDNININFQPAVSIKENEVITDLTIAPNPATTSASVIMSLLNEENVTIHIYNQVGQLVASQVPGNLSAGQHVIDIDTRDFASGVYSINILTKNGVMNRKLVVSK